MNDTTELNDRTIVDYLRRHMAATVVDLVGFTGVTATAVRQRLTRLMEQGLVARASESAGRGRPTHRYSLTPAGIRSGGNNYGPLVQALWDEIREIRDPEVRRGLLKRLSDRMAEGYRDQIQGETVQQRMAELASLMASQEVPFEFQESESGTPPVLTALACPYPDLAEHDRGVCAMEKMLLSSVLGESMRLSSCRLDGASCCTFEASGAAS